jgi:N-glycosylase/DNA lyase
LYTLPNALYDKYISIKPKIEQRLDEFSAIDKEKYFYELCFCICTPQSKAANALMVQNRLESIDFKYNDTDPVAILEDKQHYIRFHNQKSARLLKIKEQWHEIEELLLSKKNKYIKRDTLAEKINGFGLKEASHFMRNIGYTDLVILDRHILKNMVAAGALDELPNISTAKRYKTIEKIFLGYSVQVGIPVDHLDLLFWANEAGEIIK